MSKQLPPRPHLDHLRRQAKSLLASLQRGEKEAIATIRQHLPAARALSDEQICSAGYRLADAQSAIARATGFASWPHLSRHVEQLRALEGTWEFISLEVDGRSVPPAALTSSRLLIDGDRFRSETPGATYEGTFNIDVETDPHGIDIEFVQGPEAGNVNLGLFRLDGDRFTICLDMTGKSRPTALRSAAGSGHALETLRRASAARPDSVTGGVPQPRREPDAAANAADFTYVPSDTLTRLAGEWSAVRVIKDGQPLPSFISSTGRRTAVDNEIKVTFGGQLMIHALVRIDESKIPVAIDYYNLLGPTKGTIQLGIMQWDGTDACFCMASPGMDRPSDFACAAGSGQTMSVWKKAKR